jgi:hypothetical protein
MACAPEATLRLIGSRCSDLALAVGITKPAATRRCVNDIRVALDGSVIM